MKCAFIFFLTLLVVDEGCAADLLQEKPKQSNIIDVDALLPVSIANRYYKSLPKEILDELAREPIKGNRKKFITVVSNTAIQAKADEANVRQADEIVVYGRAGEPEDYIAPKLPPMLEFRAKLDKLRPRTPQEITKNVFCALGLCLIDASKEKSIEDRNEARARNPPSYSTQR